jgi:hypothetical protein
VTTLAERFKESGYRTGAVISGAPLRRTYGLDRGFDHYDDQGLGIEGDNAITPSSRPAEVTTEARGGRRTARGSCIAPTIRPIRPSSRTTGRFSPSE